MFGLLGFVFFAECFLDHRVFCLFMWVFCNILSVKQVEIQNITHVYDMCHIIIVKYVKGSVNVSFPGSSAVA